MSDPLVIADPELLPSGRRFWTDDSMFELDKDGRPKPSFAVQEVAKVFFGRGPDWLRWRYRRVERDGEVILPYGYFVLDGVPLETKKTPAGARYYSLADIERMAHALAQTGGIDGAQLANTVLLVKTIARIYGVL